MTLVRIGGAPAGRWIAWSGGKNAAHALEYVGGAEGLVTWMDDADRVAGNRVSRSLLEASVASVGLPSVVAASPEAALAQAAAQGARSVVFGDPPEGTQVDVHRAWAEAAGLEVKMPFARLDPDVLAEALAFSVRSVLTVVDHTRAPRAWIARTFSASLLEERPPAVHPTGGRGEFETFACAGTVFGRPLAPKWEDLEHDERWAVAHLAPG
ncbi:MAG: hypothetical protein AAFU79_09400, partial [Myxococcota bacterium]